MKNGRRVADPNLTWSAGRIRLAKVDRPDCQDTHRRSYATVSYDDAGQWQRSCSRGHQRQSAEQQAKTNLKQRTRGTYSHSKFEQRVWQRATSFVDSLATPHNAVVHRVVKDSLQRRALYTPTLLCYSDLYRRRVLQLHSEAGHLSGCRI